MKLDRRQFAVLGAVAAAGAIAGRNNLLGASPTEMLTRAGSTPIPPGGGALSLEGTEQLRSVRASRARDLLLAVEETRKRVHAQMAAQT